MSSRHDAEPVRPSVAQLRAFAEVARNGSFSEAAAELGVGQGSISRAVHRLEQAVGATLLARGAQGARLTAAGDAIIGDVRHVLALIDGLEARAGDAAVGGTVIVGGFRSATESLLPAILAELHSAYPDIDLEVRTIAETGGGVGQAVAQGAIDIGLTSLPTREGLVAVGLFDDPYVRVEPLRRREAELRFILWNEDCSDRAVAWLQERGGAATGSFVLDDDRAVLAHVAEGLGYSLMPQLSTVAAAGSVRTLQLADGPVRRVALCAAPAALRRPEVRAVFEALKTLGAASRL